MVWNMNDPELFNPEHLTVKHMYDNKHATVVWFGFCQGQELREHETTSAGVVQVLRGKVQLVTADTQVLEAGQTALLQSSERHSVTALEDSVLQVILVPHPRYHSLSDELEFSSPS